MNIQKVSISAIKPNLKNPRTIKDDKFKKLVQSIKEFPQMLEIRPIVVDDDMVVLGGNMRLKACKEAGLKDIYIINAKDLTPEQKKEFIIKDNVGYGEWDWVMLEMDFEMEDLENWGLDIPDFSETKEHYDKEFESKNDILITCENEIQQKELYERLSIEGYECKLLIS